MWKVAILILLAAAPAFASQDVSVEQLQQVVAKMKAARKSDGAVAREISSLNLTERLSGATLESLKAELNPRPKAVLSLELLAYSSSFLDPPAAEIPAKAPPDAAAELSLISAARDFVATTLRHMPDFIATRITRSFDNSDAAIFYGRAASSELQLVGTQSQEITYRDGQETALAPSTSGSGLGLTSQGEFGPILDTVLGDVRRGTVVWSHWERMATGVAAVFHYEVNTEASHYAVDFCCVNDESLELPPNAYHGTPAYHGSLYVDPATGAVLRITIEAELESSGPLMTSAVAVDYGNIEIGGKSYICPVQSVAASSSRSYLVKDQRETTLLRLNAVVFTNYHRFGSTVRVLTTPQSQ